MTAQPRKGPAGRASWGSLLAAMVAALAAWAAQTSVQRAEDSLDALRATGRIRIGFAVEPPYAMLLDSGEPAGESTEAARAVARELALEPVWILTEFDRLLPGLASGRFDLVAAGVFVTAQRRERVRFSRPTLRVRPGWLVAAGAVPPAADYAAARADPSRPIAVLAGSTEQATFERQGFRAPALMVVPDARSGLAAVRGGAAAALALSMPTVMQMARAEPQALRAVAAVAPEAPAAHLVALAMRHDAAALQAAVDRALAGYLGSPLHLDHLARLGLGTDDVPQAGDDGS